MSEPRYILVKVTKKVDTSPCPCCPITELETTVIKELTFDTEDMIKTRWNQIQQLCDDIIKYEIV